jgi:hypothetical protein
VNLRQANERGSIRAEMHKVVILKLAWSYVKNNPFLIPPNGLKCDIIIERESNAQTEPAAGDQQKGVMRRLKATVAIKRR